MMNFYKNQLKKNKDLFLIYKSYSFFGSVYRFLSIVVSPLLLKFNPNLISVFGLTLAIIGFFIGIKDTENIQLAILIFIISFVIDYSDGLIARYQNKSSFFGRFIDGLFDIISIGLLHILFIKFLLLKNNTFFDLSFYFIILLIYPIQHLILDRFSALARWCNEIDKQNKIQPYLRSIYFKKTTLLLLDIQHICIWAVLIFGTNISSNMLEFYLMVSFLSSIFGILLYIYFAKKFFSNRSNKLDNLE